MCAGPAVPGVFVATEAWCEGCGSASCRHALSVATSFRGRGSGSSGSGRGGASAGRRGVPPRAIDLGDAVGAVVRALGDLGLAEGPAEAPPVPDEPALREVRVRGRLVACLTAPPGYTEEWRPTGCQAVGTRTGLQCGRYRTGDSFFCTIPGHVRGDYA